MLSSTNVFKAFTSAQYGDVAALSMDVVDPNDSKSFFGTVYLNSGKISRPVYTHTDVAVAASSTAANETGIYPRSNVGTGTGTVPKDTPLSALSMDVVDPNDSKSFFGSYILYRHTYRLENNAYFYNDSINQIPSSSYLLLNIS